MGECTPARDLGDDAAPDFYSALLDDDPVGLYERAPCGYLSTSPEGTIIKVNQTFLDWTGYDRRDLLGRRSFASLLTPGGQIYHETHYAPLLAMQGSAREIALDLVTADGRRLPALVNSVVERDASGSSLVVRTAVFDARERREYERELLRAKRRAEASEERATLLARTLQQTLIPPALPEVAGLELASVYRPAGAGDEVGGDFYDVFETGRDDWVIVVGDVRGKGVDAAVVTARARYTIRSAAVRHPQPAQILDVLNQVLLHDDSERFCTTAILRLSQRGHRWAATLGCGGHPLPLLVRPGRPPSVIGRPGLLVGTFETAEFTDGPIPFEPGDAIVLYTDGVTEARGGGMFFGEDRLATAAARHAGSAQSLAEGILHDVLSFQAGDSHDDIAIVVAQRRGL